jgi:hypothetical protein
MYFLLFVHCTESPLCKIKITFTLTNLSFFTFRTLQRTNTKNSKQIFPEKELRGRSAYFHIHVSVSDLYVPTIGSAYSAAGNMWIVDRSWEYTYKSLTEIGTEAA